MPCQGEEARLDLWLYPLVSMDLSKKQRPCKPCSCCKVHTLVAPNTLHGPCSSGQHLHMFQQCHSNKEQHKVYIYRYTSGYAMNQTCCCDPSPSLSRPAPPCSEDSCTDSSKVMLARAWVPTCHQIPDHRHSRRVSRAAQGEGAGVRVHPRKWMEIAGTR